MNDWPGETRTARTALAQLEIKLDVKASQPRAAATDNSARPLESKALKSLRSCGACHPTPGQKKGTGTFINGLFI